MNRFFVAVFAAFIGLVITVPEAEAKRFGGSRSFGMQRDSNTFRKAAPPTNNAAPTRNNATPAAAQPPKRSWMGPLAGLAAGLGLAALMSHLGLGEEFGSIILMALLAFGAIMLVKMLMRRAAAPQPSGAAAGAAGAGAMRYAGNEAPATASHAGSGAASVPGAADGFDAPAFERQAKLNFIRLQAASDSGNLEDIRQFTTPEVFAELSLQLGEREPGVHRTDVLELDAEVVDVSEVDAQHVVTVRFSGMLREEQDAAASPFYGALAPDEAGHRERWLAGGRIAAARLRQAAAEAEMLSSSFVALLNHLLTRAEWARRRLSPFAGHPARLMLEGASIDFTIAADGYVAASGANAAPEVTISAPASALPGLLEGWDRVMKAVRINGNAEMADALGFVFRNLRWDPEADLAALVGDVAAHRLHEGVLSLLSTQRSAAQAAGNNLLEYLTIEKRILPSRTEIEQHIGRLRELRDAVARLEKRIERIER